MGSDEEMDKLTFPALLGLEASRQFAVELVSGARAALDAFDDRGRPPFGPLQTM